MTSKYDKKIKAILQEADLPKALSEEIKKELESHFYEKEHELRFSGLKKDEIEKQLSEDFGNDEIMAKHLNFVHRKSFYSFIKTLMQNKNKPSIFYTVFLFIIVFFLYQNTVWDMGAQIQIGRIDETIRNFTSGGFINLGLFLILNFILVIRLYRGRSLAQRLSACLLFIIILGQIFYTYSLMNRYIIVPYSFENISDRDLIEHPEDYYKWSASNQFTYIYNFKYGYQIALPQSYTAYLANGTYLFPKDLKGDEDIVAFGPPYGSDAELITVSIFDKQNSPDKSSDETWTEYYLKNKLQGNYRQLELPESKNFGVTMKSQKMLFIELNEDKKMKHNILLMEDHDRLYEILFNDKNPVHHDILLEMYSFYTMLPEAEIKWINFNLPACPFSLNIPNNWTPYQDSEETEEGFFGSYFPEKDVALQDLKDCNFKGFRSSDDAQSLEMEHVVNQKLTDYFKSKDYFILREGETQWQGLPAKRILFGINNDYNGELRDSNVRATAFAIQLKENEWFIFSYNSHPTTPITTYEQKNSFPEEIINSITIKK